MRPNIHGTALLIGDRGVVITGASGAGNAPLRGEVDSPSLVLSANREPVSPSVTRRQLSRVGVGRIVVSRIALACGGGPGGVELMGRSGHDRVNYQSLERAGRELVDRSGRA